MIDRPNNQNDDRPLSLQEARNQPWFSLYEERLNQLAEALMQGAADIDLMLAEVVNSAPQDMRSGLMNRFRALLAEKQEAQAEVPLGDLTPQQLQEAALLKQSEQLYIAHLLSEKTREKIRRAFLSNPKLLEEVLSLGEQLARRGLYLDGGKMKKREHGQIDVQATPRVERDGNEKGR